MSNKTFKVLQLLSIRAEPSITATRFDEQLRPGQRLQVEPDSRRDDGQYIWWKHKDRNAWSAEREVNGAVFMTEVKPSRLPPRKQGRKIRFRALKPIGALERPDLSASPVNGSVVEAGTIITVTRGSRRRRDGIIWWRGSAGWYAERQADGSDIYLQRVTKQQKPPADEPDDTPTPATRNYEVLVMLSIRTEPGANAPRLETGLQAGDVVAVDENTRRTVDNYVWLQHSRGWSAERTADGSSVYLRLTDATVPEPSGPTPQPGEEPPDVDALPMRDNLFQRLPVDMGNITWVQYFGNTQFAYENGRQYGYDKYFQGLHPAIDLGNRAGIPVYAGVQGVFIDQDHARLYVKSGEYILVYQHLQNRNYQPGGQVTPDMVPGEMDGANHVHFEVRFAGRNSWLINPLLMMPEAMRNAIMNRFIPYSDHFQPYHRWQTPLDQPVIRFGGPVIGPLA